MICAWLSNRLLSWTVLQIYTFGVSKSKIKQILEGCLDLILSPSPGVQIQILGVKIPKLDMYNGIHRSKYLVLVQRFLEKKEKKKKCCLAVNV